MGALNSELNEFQKKKLVAVYPQYAILKFAKIATFEAPKPIAEIFLRDFKMFFQIIPPDL